ncbi:MAG: PAS domain S-box protein [Planctomycetes bacterium]|nr:PAS domain S-box protein [Planctomycetota bacterium]
MVPASAGVRNTARLLLACLVFAAVAGTSTAQRYLLRTYTEYEGLPNAYVVDVAQEDDGRLWVMTRAGLSAYDGTEWTRVPLPFHYTDHGHMALDSKGAPWCVSLAGEVHSLGPDGWTARVGEEELPLEYRFAIALNDRGGEPRIARISAPGGVQLLNGEHWRTLAGTTRASNAPPLAVTTYRNGFLVGTRDGLFELDAHERARDLDAELGLPDGRVLALAWEPRADTGAPNARLDGLWLVSDRWIGVVRDGRFALRSTPNVPPPNSLFEFLDAAASRELGLFYGDPSGLMHLAPGAPGPIPFGQARGLPCEGALSLLVDREENLWIGHREGLSKLDGLRFQVYDRVAGLIEDEVSAVLRLDAHAFVIGQNHSLATVTDERIEARPLPRAPYTLDPRPRVMSLRGDGDGGYYVALWIGSLLHVRRDGSEETIDVSTLGIDHLADVDVDPDGSLWISGSCGVVAVDPKTWREVPDTRLNASLGRRLARDRSGVLYAITSGEGVFARRDGRWIGYRSTERADLDDAWCVFESSTGELWIGTRGGLAHLSHRGLVRDTTPALAEVGAVYSIVESRDTRLWFGTADGVVEWDGAHARRLSMENGLVGREVNRAALCIDEEQRLWVGTDRGLSVGPLDALTPPKPPPRVRIAGFEADGVRIDPSAETELAPNLHVLVVRASAVSLVDERRVGFRWRLDGFDSTWSETTGSTRFETRYTNLPAGRYHFELAARAPGGAWSAIERSAEFSVPRPLWQRSWFVVAGLALASALGWAVQQTLAQRRYTRKLAHAVEARTRELSSSRAEIVREKERLHATLESIADGVVALGPDGSIVLVNGAAERVIGARADELLGRPVEDVVRLERLDGAPFDTSTLRAPPGREAHPPSTELTLHPQRGDSRSIELAVAPVTGEGSTSHGAVIVLRDVTERLRLERELGRAERLRSLGVLAGGIAHDFNNVLTAVGGRVALIGLAAPNSGDVAKHVSAAEKALGRARDLSHQLLTFARGGEPVRAAVSITELLDDASQLAFSGSRVRVVQHFESEPWPCDVDKAQVQQVFENLLINARQAMPSGGRATLSVHNVRAGRRQHPALEDGRFVRVDVEDEGGGIAPEHLQHVFDPFFTTKVGGSGLGLATAYSVVHRHGGAITVRSRVGAGATFSVYLPVADREAPTAPLDPAAAPTVDARVLVVDDEPEVRAVLQAQLAHHGARVCCVDGEDEAVASWREARERGEPFDVAFLDLTMPGGPGGVAVARRILDVDPTARLIAMSGYASDPVLAQPARFGFRATLAKPFAMKQVVRALEEARRSGEPLDRSANVS